MPRSEVQPSHNAVKDSFLIPMDRATSEKMQQLESTITEYKNKMNQLERLLKEEEDIRDDPEKKEEVEKLRD
jgi:hypothetical protein